MVNDTANRDQAAPAAPIFFSHPIKHQNWYPTEPGKSQCMN